MPPIAAADRRCWIYQTNRADWEGLEEETRAGRYVTSAWTTSRLARPHDVVVMYGHRPIYAYGFLARVCESAWQSVEDGGWWAGLEVIRAARRLTLGEARADPVIGRWPGFRMMIGATKKIEDSAIWEAFAALLCDGDSDLQAELDQWRGRARLPQLEPEAHDAIRAHPNFYRSGTEHERRLQKRIRDSYIEWALARPLEPSDGVDISAGYFLGEAGYPDVVLVDLEAEQPTLLVVEVKRDAVPGGHTDGLTQLERYIRGVRKLRGASHWRIKPVLIALWFDPQVLRDPRVNRLGVELWEYHDAESGFYSPGTGLRRRAIVRRAP